MTSEMFYLMLLELYCQEKYWFWWTVFFLCYYIIVAQELLVCHALCGACWNKHRLAAEYVAAHLLQAWELPSFGLFCSKMNNHTEFSEIPNQCFINGLKKWDVKHLENWRPTTKCEFVFVTAWKKWSISLSGVPYLLIITFFISLGWWSHWN